MDSFDIDPTSVTRVYYQFSTCDRVYKISEQQYDFDKCYEQDGSIEYSYVSDSEIRYK